MILFLEFVLAKNSEKCGTPLLSSISDRIVEGDDFDHGTWPWLAALFRTSSSDTLEFICGGTLISQHKVLTGDTFSF